MEHKLMSKNVSSDGQRERTQRAALPWLSIELKCVKNRVSTLSLPPFFLPSLLYSASTEHQVRLSLSWPACLSEGPSFSRRQLGRHE